MCQDSCKGGGHALAPSCVLTVAFLLSPGCDRELLLLAWAHSCWFQCVFLCCETDGREGEGDQIKVWKI